MTQISKYPITQDVYDHIFDVFLSTIAGLISKKAVSDFFEEFLTPTERIMFAKRLAIGLLLAKNYDYREISKILRVSTTTISGVSILYRYGKNYRKVVDNLLKDVEKEKFWLGIGEKIASILSGGGAKTASWRYLKQELRKKRLKKSLESL